MQTYDKSGQLRCDLGIMETLYCDVDFYVEVKSLNGTIGSIVHGTTRIRSECYLLSEKEPNW